jgi:hypothetical protein
MYWAQDEPPLLVQYNFKRIKRLHPNWDVKVLDINDARGMDGFPKSREKGLSHTAISDWVRMKLLALYGGVWIDATVLLHKPLDSITTIDLSLDRAQGYSTPRHTCKSSPNCIHMENSFICSPPSNPFIVAWSEEYSRAIDVGRKKYCDEIAARYIDCHVVTSLLPYLTQYASYSVVYKTRKDLQPPLVHCCYQKGAFFELQDRLNWMIPSIPLSLSFEKNKDIDIDIIKLRAYARTLTNFHLVTGLYVNGRALSTLTGAKDGMSESAMHLLVIVTCLIAAGVVAAVVAAAVLLSTTV